MQPLETSRVLFTLPLMIIDQISKVGKQYSRKDYSYCIEILTKDLRTFILSFAPIDHPRRNVFALLECLAPPPSISNIFAFFFYHAAVLSKKNVGFRDPGWSLFDPFEEFSRFQIYKDVSLSSVSGGSDAAAFSRPLGPNGKPQLWKISDLNADYQLCESYPRFLIFPYNVNDEIIVEASKFRCKSRLPTTIWMSPTTGGSISRCSQPKVGINHSRSIQDEILLTAILNASIWVRRSSTSSNSPPPLKNRADPPLRRPRSSSTVSSSSSSAALVPSSAAESDDNFLSSDSANRNKLLIFDARPRVNAFANKVSGAGFEGASNYPFSTLSFLNIPNIHTVREW